MNTSIPFRAIRLGGLLRQGMLYAAWQCVLFFGDCVVKFGREDSEAMRIPIIAYWQVFVSVSVRRDSIQAFVPEVCDCFSILGLVSYTF